MDNSAVLESTAMADPTKEELQARVNSLNDAIASGERQVTIGGTTITYNTTDSLIRARDDARAELNRLFPPENKRSRRMQGYHAGRGFC